MGKDSQLQQLQDDCRKIINPLVKISKVKANQAKTLEEIQAVLDKLPPGATLARAVDELRKRIEAYLTQAKELRAESFRRLISDYVRSAKQRGVGCRELDSGWRVGRFEFRLRPDQSKLQVLYNGEVIIPWSGVARTEDLEQLERTATDKTDKIGIDDATLIDLLWTAYKKIRAGRRDAKKPNPELVPIADLYIQLRLELVRIDLQSRRPDCELRFARFPRWAFFYSLDRYRSIAADVPDAKRLSFETGSQRDSKRIGVRLNGLDARQSYMTFCYLKAVRGD